jgi:hypothetical protein
LFLISDNGEDLVQDDNADDLITMRDKILQSNNCTSSYQRMVVYLGMGLADRLIHQVDLVMGWRSCRCAQLSFRGRRETVRKSRRCFSMT